jgi:prolyl oligopeptidase
MPHAARSLSFIVFSAILTVGCQQAAVQKTSYPPSTKGDVVDDYFGTKVADPYRWMEDLESKEIGDWIAAQNKLTFGYLEKLRFASTSASASPSSGTIPAWACRSTRATRYFFEKNTGLQRQAVLVCERKPGCRTRRR